jgi:hypothetical protein
MNAAESRFAQLDRLLKSGAVARSACSREFITDLAPVLDSGVVTEERSGAGRRLVVRDAAAFQDFIRHNFPDVTIAEGASSRLSGVARFRDTKAVASDLPEIVTVRSWHDEPLCCSGVPVAAAAATRAHGVFSFLLTDDYRPTLHGPCALVENPALFTQFEHLKLPPRLTIYGRGRSSGRLLDWLTSQTAPDFQLLHLPDYDPVGLDEFLRIQERLGPRVRLHLPDNLPELFARHSNRELLQKPSSQALLPKLRRNPSEEIRSVLRLIEKHNAGLEHEALLIAAL